VLNPIRIFQLTKKNKHLIPSNISSKCLQKAGWVFFVLCIPAQVLIYELALEFSLTGMEKNMISIASFILLLAIMVYFQKLFIVRELKLDEMDDD